MMVQYRLIVAWGFMFDLPPLRIRQKHILVTLIHGLIRLLVPIGIGGLLIVKTRPVVPEDEVPEGSLPG
jgi:hypothetical protein